MRRIPVAGAWITQHKPASMSEDNCVAATLTGLSHDIVLKLGHRDDATRTTILDDAYYFKPARRVAVRPDVHTIDNFARAPTSLHEGVASFPRLELSAGAADQGGGDDGGKKESIAHTLILRGM